MNENTKNKTILQCGIIEEKCLATMHDIKMNNKERLKVKPLMFDFIMCFSRGKCLLMRITTSYPLID